MAYLKKFLHVFFLPFGYHLQLSHFFYKTQGELQYKKLNMDKIRGAETREELLLKNSTLYVTPIVRNGKEATVGNSPEVWKSWE